MALLNKNEKESKALPLSLPAASATTESSIEESEKEISNTSFTSSNDRTQLYGDVEHINNFDN